MANSTKINSTRTVSVRNYKFCPYCGSKTKKIKDFFECSNCLKKVFVNPLPAASVFIIKNGKFSLCRRAINPMKGKYDFIGGFLKSGEQPTKGALREVKEETSLKVRVLTLLGVYLDKYEYQKDIFDILNFVYIAKITNGKVKPQDDIEAVDWFPINTIPKNLAFKSIKVAINDLQKWHSETLN